MHKACCRGRGKHLLLENDYRIWYTTTDLYMSYKFVFSYANAKRYSKLMKGKALRKHSLHEKTAASVLLKLFIGGNK